MTKPETTTETPEREGGCSPATCSGLPEFTAHPCDKPKMSDRFTREQIFLYLEEVPLGYVSERDHEITVKLIERIQRHFVQLDPKWQPSID
jgi:hypothetical protein